MTNIDYRAGLSEERKQELDRQQKMLETAYQKENALIELDRIKRRDALKLQHAKGMFEGQAAYDARIEKMLQEQLDQLAHAGKEKRAQADSKMVKKLPQFGPVNQANAHVSKQANPTLGFTSEKAVERRGGSAFFIPAKNKDVASVVRHHALRT